MHVFFLVISFSCNTLLTYYTRIPHSDSVVKNCKRVAHNLDLLHTQYITHKL